MGRPIYGLECQCVESFLRFDSRHEHPPDDQIPGRLARAVSEVHGAPTLLIYSNPWGPLQEPNLERVGLQAFPIAHFGGTESGENYVIYRIETLP